MRKVVCNIPFSVTQAGSEPKTLVGSPDDAIRWYQNTHPEMEVICCSYWNIRENKTEVLVRKRIP